VVGGGSNVTSAKIIEQAPATVNVRNEKNKIKLDQFPPESFNKRRREGKKERKGEKRKGTCMIRRPGDCECLPSVT
jgi:hypothetical protein